MIHKSNTDITFKGAPIKVGGQALREGEQAPAFKLTGGGLEDVDERAFAGKLLIISVVPSLDTPVCSVQTKHFNEDASALGDRGVILTVSRDLSFAQKRWCAAEGVSNLVTASDHKYRTFGEAFGVELPDLGLLARAVFVVDPERNVRYVEYVPEVTDEPNYEAALAAARAPIKD